MTRNKAPGHQTQSSLEDSTYEVLGDSALLSDAETDDGNTASLTSQSVDGRTPDDLSSLADTEESHDEDGEDQFESVTRHEATTEAHSDAGLEESVYPSSDEDEFEDDVKNVGVPRQADRHVEESELTARPSSPEVDITMSPSLSHLRRQPLTDSELFEHHNLSQPRALTMEDIKSFVFGVPSFLYQEMREMLGDVVVGTKHLSKTARLTYQANMRNRNSPAYYGTIAAQMLLGLSLVSLVAWLSAHLSVTFHTNTPVHVNTNWMPLIDPNAVPVQPPIEIFRETITPSKPSADREVFQETGLGAPMQTIPVNESAEFVAHVIGDNHFILTPPKQFLSQKKQPELYVNVIRDTETLSATVNKYDGVYAVEIDRDQAWGVLDVMLYTKTKPKIGQQFQLNFGNPWLKLNMWQASAEKLSRGMRDEWSSVNDFVSQAIKQARKEFSDIRSHLNADTNDRASEISNRATAIQKDVSRIIAAQSKALSSHLANLQNAMSKDIPLGANKITKEVTKLCASITSLNPHGLARDVHEFHAQLAARAQTNAANIVKKIQRLKAQRKAEKAAKMAGKMTNEKSRTKNKRCGRKCQRKLKDADVMKENWKTTKQHIKDAQRAAKKARR